MEFSSELLFFFSALGAFNGLLMGLYFLFYAKPKHISNYFLGALLITLSIRIGKSVFFYFNPDLAIIYLQLGLSACVFIGPSLYFYLKSVLVPEDNHRLHWKYHLGIWIPLVVILGYLYPFEHYIDLWRFYVIQAIYYQWLAYLIAAGFLIKNVFQRFWVNKEKFDSIEIWILSVYFGNFIIWSAYNFCYYTSYITGALSFSFIFYLLILLLIFNKKKNSILFKNQPKYADKKIESSKANLLIQQLEQIMKEEKIFKNPSLKLPDVAKKLNILPHQLSQLINDNLEKNFSLFINEYRIKEAKELLKNNKQFTLEAIGYECGFNSKSTFYSTFKKLVGMTPAKFKDKHLV